MNYMVIISLLNHKFFLKFKILINMIKKLVHFSDLHVRLFKDHDLYKRILQDAFKQWRDIFSTEEI